MTVTELLAYALERVKPSGHLRCFFCGACCTDDYPVQDFLRETFTDLASVACPGSSNVCRGCVLALQSAGTVTLIDGTKKTFDFGGFRTFSWVISAQSAMACTPSLRHLLAHYCLTPPDPPAAVVITTTGQKHLLYRGVVNSTTDPFTLTFDGEIISYSPPELQERLALCTRLVRILGRGTLQNWHIGSVLRKSGELDPNDLVLWEEVRHDPISRLCVWLVPGKDESDQLS